MLAGFIDKEHLTKEIAEKILSEIDLLKRTILARAFRGKLDTNLITVLELAKFFIDGIGD